MHDSTHPRLAGLTPYLLYEDAAAAMDWLAQVCGFEPGNRYLDADGFVREAEMHVGSQQIWFAGMGKGYWQQRGRRPNQLFLIWVDDVDAHHARATAAGVPAEAPVDKPYAVRTYTLVDPEGYQWSFMQRQDREIQLEPGWSEVRPDGSIRTG